MIDSEIPPLWLPSRPSGTNERRFHLPSLLRMRLKGEGLPCVLVVAGSDRPLHLIVSDRAGAELARETLTGPAPIPVFLPKGAARLTLAGVAGGEDPVRLGYFPVQKVALKLHAFANGAFTGRSPRARWKAAGVAARTLRGALTALIEASPAGQAGDARRYRPYRAKYVGDFKEVPPADAAPALSFLTPLGATPLADLARCAKALAGQTDAAWEWIIAVPLDRMAAEGSAIAAAAGSSARLVTAADASLPVALSAAMDAATGGLLSPLDAVGRPTRDAVAMIRAAFARHADLVLAYTDEEYLDAGGLPIYGVFKPAFNAHLLQAAPYMGHLVAARREAASGTGFAAAAGEAVLYDFLLRLSAPLPKEAIRHIPRVAYGGPERSGAGFAPSGAQAAADALARVSGVPVELVAGGRHLRPLYPVPEPEPVVSIVVPTRDRAPLLRKALFSLIARTSYRAFEIVVVDNGSTEADTFALFEEVKAAWPATRIVRDDGDFNFPRICNAGVDQASGSLILLLNNDVEIVDGDWLGEMVSLACLPHAGVVGAKLLFPDNTVQHAGVLVGLFRYADHWFAHSAADAPGYQDRLLVRQNLSAVTGACLMVRKDVWDKIGPLDAKRFAEDCNDIDLCLRARRAGYDVVFTPFARLLHYESASRGKKRSKAHRQRLKAQRARMEAAWHTASFVDPHFNPNLDRKSLYAIVARAPEGPRDPRTDAV